VGDSRVAQRGEVPQGDADALSVVAADRVEGLPYVVPEEADHGKPRGKPGKFLFIQGGRDHDQGFAAQVHKRLNSVAFRPVAGDGTQGKLVAPQCRCRVRRVHDFGVEGVRG
jgi:hypothetical protein